MSEIAAGGTGRPTGAQNPALRITLILWSFGYFLVSLLGVIGGMSSFGQALVLNIPLGCVGVALSMTIWRLMRRASGRQTWWSLLPVIAAGASAAALITLADFAYGRFLGLYVFPDWRVPKVWIQNREVTIFILYLWSMFLQIALLWAVRTAETARALQAQVLETRIAASRAETAALRLQLNPHFLFNALNGVASLIVQNRNAQAEAMVGRLADFLRASMGNDPTRPAPLAQEFETALAYLHVEEARFGDRLTVEHDLDPRVADLETPNLFLQPIVENAIKHGVAPHGRPVRIAIRARLVDGVCRIEVVNQAHGPAFGCAPEEQVARVSSGIGLRNTRQRLAEQFGPDLSFEAGAMADGYRVVIAFPARLGATS